MVIKMIPDTDGLWYEIRTMALGGISTFKLDPNSPECSTPLMKQFIRVKEQAEREVGGAILFFRMGDFYELFAEDAIIAAPILGITLTARNSKSENPVPMAGIPFHSATNYIQKLLNAGKKVAIAEQIVPEGMTIDQIKGIVERRIVRTFTPAVQFEMQGTTTQNFLATVAPASVKSGEQNYVLALLEPATGVVRVSESLNITDLMSETSLDSIRHFLNFSSKIPAEFLHALSARDTILVEEIPHNWVSDAEVEPFLKKQYGRAVLHPLLEEMAAQKAVGILIQYVLKTQALETLSHLHDPQALHESDRLVVGPHTHTHLDTSDLLSLIDKTATSMGSRHLRDLLFAPFKTVTAIEAQQDSVKELAAGSLESSQIHTHLRDVYDLDRILGRIATKLAHPRDTYALGMSLKSAFQFEGKLACFESTKLRTLSDRFTECRVELSDLAERIARTQKSDAPLHSRDGGIFELGTDPELDRLIHLTQDGERFVVELERREREATGIGSLKVKYNRVFGYFIEISNANLKNVPTHYQRKQSTVGGERFFTEELKKFEEEILSASSKQRALETTLFQQLISDLVSKAGALKQLAEVLGEIDALISLSMLALKGTWTFPKIDDSFQFELKGSRHPVVDEALRGQFVANDIELDPQTARTLIITGPNMGGKSTLMRQMALIILLGQIGAPVPASSAHWGIFDSLYTRIGAQDAIAKGQSTFMVEMVELAHILSNANERSFVVLDEIGRGTSTYDGMSVASASLEYLHAKSQARIVFATHYHELTDLESRIVGLKNTHMKVLDEKGKLTFLYELAQGRSSKSFGIQVAELAGLPKPVIKQAWSILKQLETNSPQQEDPNQLSLFSASSINANAQEVEQAGLTIDPQTLALADEVRSMDLNSMRPIDALNFLMQKQSKLSESC